MEIQIRTKELKPAFRKALSVFLAVLMLMSSVLVAFTSLATGEASSISEETSTTRPLITTTMAPSTTAPTTKATTAPTSKVTTTKEPTTTSPTTSVPNTTQPTTAPSEPEISTTVPITGGIHGDESGNSFSFYVADASTVTITGYNGDESYVVIPSVIAGYPVTEIGEGAFNDSYIIENVVIPEGVKKIGNYAFSGASSLKGIKLPESLEKIGYAAFQYSGITSIAIPSGIKRIENDTFFRTERLKSVILPDSLKEIGSYAFYDSGLTSITIPEGVKTIELEAFGYCQKLESVTLPESLEEIGNFAFQNTGISQIAIPENVIKMGDNPFKGASELSFITVDKNNTMFLSDSDGLLFDKNKELLISYPLGRNDEAYTVPNGVTAIGAYAFEGAWVVRNLKLPDSLVNIGDYAFSGYWIENLDLPDNLQSIGEGALNLNVDEFKVPASLTSVGNYIFSNINCSKITVDSRNAAFSSDENGVLFNKDKTKLFLYPCYREEKSYRIPNAVTTIEKGAFDYCGNLETIEIPDGVSKIPEQAFAYCDNLKYIHLPESITEINEYAFQSCQKLTRVVLGSNIEKILEWAFYDCSKLTDVHYNGTKDDFDKIDIGDNDELLSANIRYCTNSTTSIIPAKAPGCTEEGNTEGVGCSACGMAFSGAEIIPVTHVDENPVDGICELCGASANNIDLGTTTVNIPQGDHYLRFAPAKSGFYRVETVGEIGCNSVCNSKKRVIREGSWDGEKYVVEAYLNAGEVYYWFVSNYSSYTSAELTLSYFEEDPRYDGEYNICNGFLYTVNDDGNAEIRGFYGDYFELDLIIPSEIDGYPVTSIGGFGWSDSLGSVTVPEGVTVIKNHAFDCCWQLGKVYLPDSLETIGYGAFSNCENLIEITIGSGLRSVGNCAFDYCDSLRKVYYNGHQTSWDSIKFGYDNNCFYNAEFVFCESTDTKPVDGYAATCLTDGYTDGIFCNTCNTWASGHELIPAGHTDKDNNGICEVCEKYANDIEAGQTKKITSTNGSIVYLAFTPEESDWYSFYSISDYDTHGYIYDADKNLIDDNDDYYNSDFVVERYLRAGEKYYFGARNRDSDGGSDSFNVKLVKGSYNGEDHGYNNNDDGNLSIGDTIYHYGYEAVVGENNTCVITCINDGNPNIIIPSTLRGYTVVGVDTYALLNWRSSVEVIEFPATVTSIPVTGLIDGRFFALKEIVVEKGNKYYKTIDGVLYNADVTELLFCPNGYKGKLTIPATVKSIYPDALTHANGITGFEFENGNTAFCYENGILYSADKKRLIKAMDVKGDFVVPDSVETIDASAFAGFDDLKSVKISKNVTSIAYATFFDCESLTEVQLPENLEKIGVSAFERCTSMKSIDLGNTLKEIGNSAFYRSGLESVTLPDSLETCGHSAFAVCENIESIDFGKGLSIIGSSMFYNDVSIKNVTFPANIKEISGSAFAHTGIENLVIPDTVTFVGDYAFGSCDNLKTVVVGDGAISIKRAFANCNSLVSAKVGANVKTMEQAFTNCSSLETVEFAEGFNGYMYRAFEGCVKLKDVDFPSTVTDITYWAFVGCESLESVELPENLESIGYEAFIDCTSLDEIKLPDSLQSVGDGAFDNTAWYNQQPNGDVYLEQVLYEYKGTMPKNYTLETKAGTTIIADSAFVYESRLKSVMLNDGLKYINSNAFAGTGITSVVIPDSVVSIDCAAFDECNKLTDVYYRGTEAQWKAIYIDDYNQPLLSANIHFGVCTEHKNIENIAGEDATCTTVGYTDGVFCNDCKCWLSGHELIKSGHKDENKDKYCDRCFAKIGDILPGETVTVNVEAGEIEHLMFSPEAHGQYIFYSDSKQNTYGYLFDENYNVIKQDNNSGVGNNFRIKYNLTPGNLYYWGAGYYSSTQSGSFDVKLDADIQGTVDGFRYRVTDGNATIISYSGSSKNIDIPSEIDGFTVTRIASYAFDWKDEIRSVTVPDSVVSIGGRAFSGCTSLRNIELGKGVTILGDRVFAYCYNLQTLEISENLTEIGENVFYLCDNLKSFTVDKNNPNFVSDKNGVLYSRDMSTVVRYPSGNQSKIYTLPATVRKINNDAFSYVYHLEAINVENGNKYFVNDDNGVLYTKNYRNIVVYPIGKQDVEYTVPGTVECVYSDVFRHNSYLEKLKLSEGVKRIAISENEANYESFGYNLREIYIPITVNEIDPGVFSEAYNISKIYGRPDSYAYEFYKEYKDKEWPFNETPEFVTYYSDELFVYLETESYAVKSNIYCYGYASEGARIYIYDGDHLIGNNEQFKGNQYSKWEANVPLYKPVDSGSDHVITAVAIDANGNKIVSLPITVHYEKNAVVFQDFQMVHSYDNKLHVTTDNVNRVHTLNWIPYNDFDDTYRVKFLNSNKLVELYIVSTLGDGSVSKIKLERAGNDTWVGKGSFGQYTPGVITFEALFKKDFELKPVGPIIKITYLIDPSGNVYDFSTDNPIEDVTATIYYKDENGYAVQWDAEYYNQINPVITGKDGFFQWDVHEGKWQVKFEKDGYETLVSDWMDVPPEVKDLKCFMKSVSDLKVVESYYKDGYTTVYFNKYLSSEEILNAVYSSALGIKLSSPTLIDEQFGVFEGAVYSKDEFIQKTAGVNCITFASDSYPGTIKTTLDNISFTPVNLTESYSYIVTASKDEVYIGDELVLTLSEEKGKLLSDEIKVNVSVSNELVFDNEISDILSFDQYGKATLILEAGMPGEAVITFTVADYETSYVVEVKAKDESHICDYDDYTIIPSTCTKYGCEYRTCIECGNVEYVYNYSYDKHNYVENVVDSAIKTIATCSAKAVYYKSCVVCGKTNEETFTYGDMLNHVEDEPFKENETETSYDLVTMCKYCSYVFNRETITVEPPVCAHTDCTIISYVAPTCSEDGRTEGKICNDCGETVVKSTVIVSEGHKEETIPSVAATCEKDGLTEGKKCKVCGVTTVEQKLDKAKGHNEETIAAIAVTCEKDGRTEGKKCKTCGVVTVKQTVVKATGHSEKVVNSKDATAEADGYTGDTVCTKCKKTLSVGEKIPALSKNCKCNCHKSGISKFFFKIVLFFQKIFKNNQICKCGAKHY